jgi:hypothetical protein
MKNLIFILLVIFTFYSCTSDEVSFKQISKKVVMDSGAWKIFIFANVGETMSVGSFKDNFDNTIKDKFSFVEDIWQIYNNDDLFLNNQKVAFKDAIVNANFNLSKRKK